MDADDGRGAMYLIGQFSDEMTRVVDEAFGTHWAEIEDILAIAAIAADTAVTTRRLAEISGLDRRAISRMVVRLREEGLVSTRPSASDGRAVEVVLTARGQRRAEALRSSIAEFFADSSHIAAQIRQGLADESSRPPVLGSSRADPMDLLLRTCEAGVALVRVMPESAIKGNLAGRQRAALVQIASMPGLRPADLAPMLDVSRAGAVYIIDQLCSKGFVRRRRGRVPQDKRAVTLEATPDGIAAVRAVIAGIEAQRESLTALFWEIELWKAPAGSPAVGELRSGAKT